MEFEVETWREGLGSLLRMFGAFSSKFYRWVDLLGSKATQAKEGRISGVKFWPNPSWVILGLLRRGPLGNNTTLGIYNAVLEQHNNSLEEGVSLVICGLIVCYCFMVVLSMFALHIYC